MNETIIVDGLEYLACPNHPDRIATVIEPDCIFGMRYGHLKMHQWCDECSRDYAKRIQQALNSQCSKQRP